MTAFLATILLSAIAVVAIYTIYILVKYKDVPPGPWGLPILGYLPFISPEKPQITLTNLAKKYGPIYSLNMGSVFTVVLSDHKLIRDAFSKDAFSGRAPLYLTHGIMQGQGLICAEGALWKDQRKLTSTWLREFGMTKHSANRQNLEARIIKGIDNFIEELKAKNGNPTVVLHTLPCTLGNIVNDIVFGYTFGTKDKTWNWMLKIQEEAVEKMGVAGVVNFLPFIRLFSKSIREIVRKILEGQMQSHRIYLSISKYTRAALGYEKFADNYSVDCMNYSFNDKDLKNFVFDPKELQKSNGDCVLINYLKEQKRRIDGNEDDAKFVTDKQLFYYLADLFGAGLDTTAVTLSWYFLFVAIHSDVQANIREEIQSVCGERAPNLEDWDHLNWTQATISEVQRIRSVVPIGIPHGCKETTSLAGYVIPKDSMIVALQWAVHMDNKVWDEPEKFNPSRFMDNEGKFTKPQEFIPFQTGKRMCPGDELARLIMFLHTSRVLWRHRVSLPDGFVVTNIDGHVGLTLSPPPVPLIFQEITEETK